MKKLKSTIHNIHDSEITAHFVWISAVLALAGLVCTFVVPAVRNSAATVYAVIFSALVITIFDYTYFVLSLVYNNADDMEMARGAYKVISEFYAPEVLGRLTTKKSVCDFLDEEIGKVDEVFAELSKFDDEEDDGEHTAIYWSKYSALCDAWQVPKHFSKVCKMPVKA